MSVRKRTWKTAKGETREAWIVDYLDQNGRRHIETLARKKEAEARAAQVRIAIGKGTHVAPSDSITVAQAAENWLKRAEADGLERSTTWAYRTHTDGHILPKLGRIKLAKLSTATIEKFRDDLLAENSKLSRATARKVLVSLKGLLKGARYGHLAEGVVIKKNGKRERGGLERGRDFPTPDEISRLHQAAKGPRQRALLLTAAQTGLRASELRGLRWSDVDLQTTEPSLHVRQRADRWKVIGPLKSDAGIRTVPLSPDLIDALKAWKLKCPKTAAPGALVFPGAGGQVLHHSNMRRALDRLMRDAQVVKEDGKPKYGLHSFRHFFASWLINSKALGGRALPPKEAQTLLGHSSITLTYDVYGHMFPGGGDRKELAEASSLLLAAPPADNVVPFRGDEADTAR
jgi:integrase